MHRRAVLCTMCGGKFFPASLAFHQKACAKKQNFVLLPCPYCDVEVPKPELNTHIASMCKKAPKSARPSKDVTATSGGAAASTAGTAPDGSQSGIFDEAARMRCPVCNRWFSQDRIGKHQAICRNLEEKHKTKRPTFDSFKQRKFDPLVQRSDIGERPLSAAEASALRAARSYYTAERLQQTDMHNSSLSMSNSVSQAKKTQALRKNGGEVAATTKATMRRATGARDAQRRISQNEGNEENLSSVASRPATGAGRDRRASGTSRSGARGLNAPTGTAAARGEASALKKDVSQPLGARNKSTVPVQQRNRSSRSIPSQRIETRKVCNPHTGRSGMGGAGGGAILETNEASIENTLAYPNYPASWNETTVKREVPSPTFDATRIANHPTTVHRGMNMSGRGTQGGPRRILETNETSPDNPLAYPFR